MYTESTSHVDEGVGADQVDLKNADNSLGSDSDEGLNTDSTDDDYIGPWRVPRSLHGSLPLDLSDRIPLEIIESIIDCMVQAALVPTAQVCRAWYPRARHNLYSTIRLQSRRCYDLLVQQVRTSPRVKQRLATTDGLIVTHFMERKGDTIPFLDALPLVLANALPALRVLSIEGALRPAMHPSFYFGLLQFKHIVSLRLSAVELSNITQLERIIYACPHIAELGLDRVTLVSGATPVRWGSSRPAHTRSRIASTTSLRRLDFKLSLSSGSLLASVSIVDWLVSSAICTSLRDLEWAVRGPMGAIGHMKHGAFNAQLDRLLETTGTSLSSFEEQWPGLSVGSVIVPNLVHNRALRYWTFTVNINRDQLEDGWSAVATHLRMLLSTVRSYKLQCITIRLGAIIRNEQPALPNTKELSPPQERFVSRTQLRRLHNVMVQPYFGALTAVHVAHPVFYHEGTRCKGNPRDAENIRTDVQQLLGPWHDRGLVKFSHMPDPYV
ncbi:hypothetical protein EVJ58_g7628 [Rhodofomes roseus]|uniref:Uncharacterized protein n=1 Tax=Rhodofomes roseus TaxID=34475 RepID=A0A4Y9Y6N5_9APHY|nr:hypothetical protein EVJ58_g7628 [Rhodofomes roseus]